MTRSKTFALAAGVLAMAVGTAGAIWPEQAREIRQAARARAQPWIDALRPAKPDASILEASGRIEALEIDLAAKYGGRLISVGPREGDRVSKGAVIAELDRSEISASLRRAEAEQVRAAESLAQAEAVVAQRRSDVALADAEYKRAATLRDREYVSGAAFDLKRAAHDSAEAALRAAHASLRATAAGISMAEAEVERLKRQFDEHAIVAPRSGQVLYRLAEPGEVVAAGQRILTIVDLTDISLTVFLPMADAGKLSIGHAAEIVLDAMPDRRFPARVEFVSPRAQFTPKTVETREERAKFVFRVKLRITDSLGLPLNPGQPATAAIRLNAGPPGPVS
ncbi:MAG: HlyD family secretion protein [Beijerinckiaceae bacterium]